MDKNLDKQAKFLFYQSNEGTTKIQIILGDETIWATQKSMAEIFNVKRNTITEHLQNIFQSFELQENSVCRKIRHTASDGKQYKIQFYNLDVIIAVGYRVNSYKATQFRIWATKILKEYLIKGFVLNDDRLKQGTQYFGKDYFDELLERIREIRASERRFYLKITDLYATAIDYDENSPVTKNFYAKVQNKLHWAIHQHTAAELISKRADSRKPNMGLTTWNKAKQGGKVLKSDVSIAKNYLTKDEISELNTIVSMYLDFAENMAKRRKEMTMINWVKRLNDFLKFNEYGILLDKGKISHKLAKKKAEKEYSKFRVKQDKEFISDFDKVVGAIKETGKIPQNKKIRLSNFNRNLVKAIKTPLPKEWEEE